MATVVHDRSAPERQPRRLSRRTRESALPHATLAIFAIAALLPFVSIALIAVYPKGQPAQALTLPHAIDFANFTRA